ncbi:MAG: hypothetical protein JSR21_05595 [Proteobacteria bacterium]|nr:hypothetical protein [Pseudomonadota bacterium]
MEYGIEIALIVLLGVTLFHALRLERALGVLRRDRAALEQLVAAFNASTQQAEAGIERLRNAADGAGQQIARRIETATALRDDLHYLTERGESIANRIDALVRAARPLAPEAPRLSVVGRAEPADAPRARSQAERDLLKALRMAR